MIDASPAQLETIRRILGEHAPGCEVRAFGSRVTWTAKDYSDLDLAVVCAGPLESDRLHALRDAFAESDLPFRVDVLDWHGISESFRKVIEKRYEVVRAASSVDSAWRRQEVSSLISDGKLVIGDGYRAKNDELSSTGIPFARAGNINDGFQFDGADHFPLEHLQRVGNKVSQPGDVVFTSKGTVGRFAFVREATPRFVYSPQLCFWRSTDHDVIDPRYLYYWMNSWDFYKQYKGVAGQTDMAEYVSLSDQRRMKITLPPLAEQKSIAQILGALDDKIELNRRMNATLEAMARALFQSWFVDFDPVRAKIDGRQPPHLDPATAALFPDAFQNSELGHIPKGWIAGTVKEAFDLTMGQSPPGETYNEEGNGLPFYQGRTDFGFRFPTRRVFCSAPTRFAKPGDTLVSVRAPVGDINMADEECSIGRGVAAVRHKSGASSFTYHAMANLYPDFAAYEAEGTVFGSINKDNFENLHCIIPPRSIVTAYELLAGPLDDQIRTLEQQSRTLATLRDTLLPKLLSGEIGLNGAMRSIEAAG